MVLTEEELAELVWDAGQAPSDRRLATAVFGGRVQDLAAEVRRLRGDDWIEAAARELGEKWGSQTFVEAGGAAAIIRKHRGGRA